MKKYLFLLLVCTVSFSFAQQNMEDKRKEVEAAKIAYITKAMNLSPEQAERFWPMYNEYSDKRRMLNHQIKDLRAKFDDPNMTDAQLEQTFDKIIEIKEQEIQLDKAYKLRLLQIVDIKQLIAMYQAEKEFIRMVVRKARQHQK